MTRRLDRSIHRIGRMLRERHSTLKTTMKKWLRLSFLMGEFAFAGEAVDWKALKPQGYVSDFANVIDAGSRSQLEAYGGMVERSTGAQMALVTIPSLQGEPIEDVANALYRAWGV